MERGARVAAFVAMIAWGAPAPVSAQVDGGAPRDGASGGTERARADADRSAEPDAAADTDPAADPEADADTDATSESDAVADPDVMVDQDANADSDADADQDTDVDQDADPDEDWADAAHDEHAHEHPHEHDDDAGSDLVFRARAITPPRPPDPLPASPSELTLRVGALRAVPRRSAESLLTLAPGLFLVNHAGAFHASTVLFRGFDAGEGRDLEVLVSGVPLNEPSNAHGHGYADAHALIPELVHAVRVTGGPFAPAQSDFAIAGTAEYQLGPAWRGLRVQGELGSFDTRRLVLAWAPIGAERGTFIGFDLREGAGFGANRAATSVALNAGYEHVASRELRISVFGIAHFAEFRSAGVVRADDVTAGRLPCAPDRDAQLFCTPDPSQGGSASRVLVATTLAWTRPGTLLEQTIWAGWRRLRVRENFTGFLLDPRGDALDQQYETGTVGLRGRYRAELAALGELPQALEVGWIARHDTGTTRAWRARASDGVPYAAAFDDEIDLTHVGAHVAADLRFAEWIALRAAVRADGFAFATLDRAEPDRDREGERLPARTSDAIGISIQPRGTLRIALVPGVLEWQTSAGIGTRSSDAIALSEGERAPFARAIATETGLALRARERRTWDLDARAAAFHTHVDRELVFDPNRGRNVHAGASSRLGALAFARLRVERWLDVAGSFAWTEAFLLPEGAGWESFSSDERLPYVPRWTGRVDVAVQHPIVIDGEEIVLGGALGIGMLGERPLPLGAAADPVVLVDVALRARWRLFELGVQVQNLFDTRWQQSVFHYVSSFDPVATPSRVPAIHASAGAPISVLATLAILVDESAPLQGIPDEGGISEQPEGETP
ncbi:MAG: TonB-dependent receptor [Myxococcota bacterium]|nr:TonB-dependent receptor [Myxococcota bacterium]